MEANRQQPGFWDGILATCVGLMRYSIVIYHAVLVYILVMGCWAGMYFAKACWNGEHFVVKSTPVIDMARGSK